MNIAPATASVILIIKIVDDSGLPVTGLVAATFPATSYVRAGAASVSITLSDLAAVNSSYSSGGVKEIGGGRYRLDVPDAAFSTSNLMVEIFGEASGKRIVAPQITCQYMKSDLRQWVGSGPGGLLSGRVQVKDRLIVLEGITGLSFGADTIEWGPEGLGNSDDYLVGCLVVIAAGTGIGQARVITNYVFSTGVMTVDRPWTVSPDSSSEVDVRADSWPILNSANGIALNASERNSLAAVVMRRTMANVEADAAGDTLNEASLYGLVQRVSKSSTIAHANKITVYRTDGITELAQITTANDGAANPITKVGV